MTLHRAANRRAALRKWQESLIWEKAKHKRKANEEQQTLRKKIIHRQNVLGQCTKDGVASLASYLRNILELGEHTIDVPTLPRKLSVAEFHEPPLDLEIEIGDSLASKVTIAQASSPLYWLICHLGWLEDNLLPEDIHAALCSSSTTTGKEHNERLEAETRNFLRRSGGIYVRGHVSVLSDCPISRAWWRRRLAREATSYIQPIVDVDAVHRVLYRRRPVWEEFVMIPLRRFTVTGHPRVRAAIVAHLMTLEDPGKVDVATTAQTIARHGLGRALDELSCEELSQIATGESRS